MARLKRLAVSGCVHHIVMRGLAGTPIFAAAEDFARYAELLARWSSTLRVEVHAYVLMPSEVQALVTPQEGSALGRLVQALGRDYTTAFNRRIGRVGTLWQGRFQAAPVESGPRVVDCMRYIEQAPVRQGFALRADACPWSTAAHHVGRGNLPWLTDPPAFWALGNTPFERQAAYALLLQMPLDAAEVSQIASATAGGWALGSAVFAEAVSAHTARRALPQTRGRPRIVLKVEQR